MTDIFFYTKLMTDINGEDNVWFEEANRFRILDRKDVA